MSEWQPIETAPTEPGDRAIVYAPSIFHNFGTVGEAFIGNDGCWYWAGSTEGYHDNIADSNSDPTHWMPLPSQPEAKS